MNTLSRLRERMLATSHDAAFRLRRMAHRRYLPPLGPDDRAIVAALEEAGAASSSLAALGVAGSDALLRDGDALMREMETLPLRNDAKDYVITPSAEHISRHPAILRWGLDERLLAIAESYIGTLVTYRGVLARIDIPDGSVRETRIWHRDQEDSRILKIIVYLDDVDDAGGPFEYLPADLGQPVHLARGSKLRIDDNAALADMVPPDRWRAIVGARGTVGFADTCRVFHRGRLPTSRARQSLFFAYNARRPMRPDYCGPLFDIDRFLGATGPLTAGQHAALDFSYLQ